MIKFLIGGIGLIASIITIVTFLDKDHSEMKSPATHKVDAHKTRSVENEKIVRKVEPRFESKGITKKRIDYMPRVKSKLKAKNQTVSSCFCGKYVPNSEKINTLRSIIDQPECNSHKAMIIECERGDVDARRCYDEGDNDDGYARKLICT